jgi:hypothetical protein
MWKLREKDSTGLVNAYLQCETQLRWEKGRLGKRKTGKKRRGPFKYTWIEKHTNDITDSAIT